MSRQKSSFRSASPRTSFRKLMGYKAGQAEEGRKVIRRKGGGLLVPKQTLWLIVGHVPKMVAIAYSNWSFGPLTSESHLLDTQVQGKVQ